MKEKISRFSLRRLLAVMLAVCLIAAVAVVPAAAEDEPVVYGDINSDGEVNTLDALLALQHCVGKADFNYNQIIRGNVDNDDSVSSKDALNILQHSVGLINLFPVEQQIKDEIEAYAGEQPLTFNESGKFKVLQISDMMFTKGSDDANAKTKSAIEALIDAEKPDFVMFCGNMVSGYKSVVEFRAAVTSMVEKLENEKIPWSHVFGPCDIVENSVSGSLQETIYQAFPCCMSNKSVAGVSGITNYVIPVKNRDGKIALNLWALDTGSSLSKRTDGIDIDDLPKGFYETGDEDFVDFSQILWYINTSEKIKSLTGKQVPGIMFGSVPVPEFQMISSNPLDGYMQGYANEKVTASKVNSGLFTALFEYGDVLGYYCGHNTTNNFSGKYCGFNLGYDGSVGYAAEHKESVMGGRVFEFDEADPADYSSYFSYLKNIDPKFTTEMSASDWDVNASAYKVDKNTIMLADCDTTAGVVAEGATVAAEKTEKTQGAASLKLTPTTSGQTLNITYGSSISITDYEFLSADVYISKDPASAGGNIKLELISGSSSRYALKPVAELKQGWNTVVFAKNDMQGNGGFSSVRSANIGLDGVSSVFLGGLSVCFDNIFVSNPAPTYIADSKTLMINSFETTLNTGTEYLTQVSTDAECTQGLRSLRINPTTPVGQGASVGAMALFYPEKALDLTGYDYIGLDLYVSDTSGIGNGMFQVNFASSGVDGFNHNGITISSLKNGWNHIEIERSAISEAVTSDWSSIKTIRMSWFNYAQVYNGCYFLVDNFTAFNK